MTAARVAPRIGVIGCGAIATRRHIPLLQEAGAVITAVASRRVETATAVAGSLESAAVCASWSELVTREDVDAVAVCTPNALHTEQALAALDAGKHVLIEKPVATTVADADRLIAAATGAGLVAMVAHDARFAAPVAALRDVVGRGDIGTVTSVSGRLGHGGPAQWAPDAAWFFDATLAGGGALLDLGVHLVDAVRYVLDDEFAEVSAELAPVGAAVEEDGVVLFRTARDVSGTVHASWRCVAGPDVGMTVHGTTGTVVWSGTDVELRRPDCPPHRVVLTAPPTSPQAIFVDALRDGAPALPDLYDGRAAVAVIEAAYTAARTGRRTPVSVPA